MKYALIDMGSNSVRLTAYDVDQTAFRILFREKIMAGLAGYVEHGRLSQEGIDCACRSLREFQATLALLRIRHLAVFATASLRNVSNTAQAVEQIRRSTGIPVEVLTGEAEAEYGFLGAACDTRLAGGLFADVGGASTELALFAGQQVQKAVSVPVGSLKLYRDCVKKILPGRESQRRIEDALQACFRTDGLRDMPRADHLVCVGGTARASLRLCRKLFGLPEDRQTFSREHLDRLSRQLRRGGKETADLILRYEPERIHTLVPGVMILAYLSDRFDIKEITVSRCGVREGYLRRKIQPLAQGIS